MNTVRGRSSLTGFTLVEVMIALIIMLIVFLALMQTALVGIDSNMINTLRNEAVNIAEIRMNEARNSPFDSLVSGSQIERRKIRNLKDPSNPSLDFPFTKNTNITNIGGDNKQVNITVTWEWKEKTVANGNPYTHSITTIRGK
jgi:prepilin-type N-terminal cleavage/methylation domain-containing protein